MTPLVPMRTAEELLGLSRDTIDRLRDDGDLPYVRIGTRIMFRVEDLDAFIAAHRVPSAVTAGEGS